MDVPSEVFCIIKSRSGQVGRGSGADEASCRRIAFIRIQNASYMVGVDDRKSGY